MFVFNPFHIDLGIDLGTANTIVYAQKRGFICNEDSYIDLIQENQTLAVGNAAKEMMGRTPSYINVVRPLSDGVISDFDAGEAFIKSFIKRADISRIRIGRVVMGVPTQASEVEITLVGPTSGRFLNVTGEFAAGGRILLSPDVWEPTAKPPFTCNPACPPFDPL